MASEEQSATGHEGRDVHVVGVWLTGLGLALFLCFTLVVVWVFAYALDFSPVVRFSHAIAVMAQPADAAPNQTKGTRLDTRWLETRRRLAARQSAPLVSYAWDGTSATARIPIARAIDLLAARGLPNRASAEGGTRP